MNLSAPPLLLTVHSIGHLMTPVQSFPSNNATKMAFLIRSAAPSGKIGIERRKRSGMVL
jgi:hypothetical protein